MLGPDLGPEQQRITWRRRGDFILNIRILFSTFFHNHVFATMNLINLNTNFAIKSIYHFLTSSSSRSHSFMKYFLETPLPPFDISPKNNTTKSCLFVCIQSGAVVVTAGTVTRAQMNSSNWRHHINISSVQGTDAPAAKPGPSRWADCRALGSFSEQSWKTILYLHVAEPRTISNRG